MGFPWLSDYHVKQYINTHISSSYAANCFAIHAYAAISFSFCFTLPYQKVCKKTRCLYKHWLGTTAPELVYNTEALSLGNVYKTVIYKSNYEARLYSTSQSCEVRDFHPQATGIMLQATGKMWKAIGKKYQQANKQAASMKIGCFILFSEHRV